ncbi:MAG: hypothetical protein M3Q97_00935 [Bacteroidota bacterium]|nr:hypothetical protein [Bacteroidota bacterium]
MKNQLKTSLPFILSCFLNLSGFSQSNWEPSGGQINGERGEYTENNQVPGHPYTIFNRNRGLEEQLGIDNKW